MAFEQNNMLECALINVNIIENSYEYLYFKFFEILFALHNSFAFVAPI